MLARREFIKISAILAAGAVLPILPSNDLECTVITMAPVRASRPILRFHGDKKSGCAFHPELTDIWAGGGAALPDFI